MLEKSNPILRDIWFFLEISPLALHTINSKSTKETGNAERKLEFREHIKARKLENQNKIRKNWKKLEKKLKNINKNLNKLEKIKNARKKL